MQHAHTFWPWMPNSKRTDATTKSSRACSRHVGWTKFLVCAGKFWTTFVIRYRWTKPYPTCTQIWLENLCRIKSRNIDNCSITSNITSTICCGNRILTYYFKIAAWIKAKLNQSYIPWRITLKKKIWKITKPYTCCTQIWLDNKQKHDLRRINVEI